MYLVYIFHFYQKFISFLLPLKYYIIFLGIYRDPGNDTSHFTSSREQKNPGKHNYYWRGFFFFAHRWIFIHAKIILSSVEKLSLSKCISRKMWRRDWWKELLDVITHHEDVRHLALDTFNFGGAKSRFFSLSPEKKQSSTWPECVAEKDVVPWPWYRKRQNLSKNMFAIREKNMKGLYWHLSQGVGI